MKYKYQRYKKIRGERMLRNMWGDYDENGTYMASSIVILFVIVTSHMYLLVL